jgi:hypothetical protein
MSTEQAACMGCFVNPPLNWLPYGPNSCADYFIYLESLRNNAPSPSFGYSATTQPGLTGPEKECLKHLVEAWNLFVGMDNKHPSDNSEFCKAIHDAQKMLALRVARRVDTDVWSQWPKEHLPTDPIT